MQQVIDQPQRSEVLVHVDCLNCGTIQDIEPTVVGALCVRCVGTARRLGITL
ncbi:MAG TPA: hypothetical protein VGZ03_06280 [Acidimicrobiales bacterium]|nr:hypothetical protein [Acidimicrobiales bacterium]